MINTKKSYKVTIFGDQYTLVSDDSEQHILHISEMVDSIMKEVAQKTKLSDAKKFAVYAALQLASKLATMETTSKMNMQAQEELLNKIEQELLKL